MRLQSASLQLAATIPITMIVALSTCSDSARAQEAQMPFPNTPAEATQPAPGVLRRTGHPFAVDTVLRVQC
jgi:hypothetical protein